MPRRRAYLALLLGWSVLVFLLTSIPNPDIRVTFRFADKAMHLAVYAVMGLFCGLWRRASGSSPGQAALETLLFVAVAGAVDEVHQFWIPGRTMSFLDWTADLSGGAAGAIFSALLPRIFPSLLAE